MCIPTHIGARAKEKKQKKQKKENRKRKNKKGKKIRARSAIHIIIEASKVISTY